MLLVREQPGPEPAGEPAEARRLARVPPARSSGGGVSCSRSSKGTSRRGPAGARARPLSPGKLQLHSHSFARVGDRVAARRLGVGGGRRAGTAAAARASRARSRSTSAAELLRGGIVGRARVVATAMPLVRPRPTVAAVHAVARGRAAPRASRRTQRARRCAGPTRENVLVSRWSPRIPSTVPASVLPPGRATSSVERASASPSDNAAAASAIAFGDRAHASMTGRPERIRAAGRRGPARPAHASRSPTPASSAREQPLARRSTAARPSELDAQVVARSRSCSPRG